MKKVKITVLKTTLDKELAEEYGMSGLKACPMMKAGDVFYADYAKPDGFCDEAWKAIYQVVAERLYRVSHRNAELSEAYAPDAEIHTSWQRGGVESFIGKAPQDAGSARPNVNRCNSPLVHRNGTRAVVEYPSTTIRAVSVGEKEAVLTSWMRLVYRCEKRDGTWKITALTAINEWDSLAPAIPGDELSLDRDALARLRPSYRYLAYIRHLAGGKVNPDELGVDRPDEMAEFYRREMEWLGKTK